jgi:hypothetical protein
LSSVKMITMSDNSGDRGKKFIELGIDFAKV